MKLDRYELKAGRNLTTFEFLSEGPKGQITKLVQLQQMNFPNLYNLAFGDMNSLTGQLDDKAITDNGDSAKVLASVVAAVYAFTGQYPEAWIYATGSTVTRTRLYRMGINKYFDIVEADFEIMGEHQSDGNGIKRERTIRHLLFTAKSSKFEQ